MSSALELVVQLIGFCGLCDGDHTEQADQQQTSQRNHGQSQPHSSGAAVSPNTNTTNLSPNVCNYWQADPIGLVHFGVFLLLDLADATLDFMFCKPLWRDGNYMWMILLATVTTLGIAFTRMGGAARRMAYVATVLDLDATELASRVFASELVVYALEDATLVMIMAFVDGAYDPSDKLSTATLGISTVIGLLSLVLFLAYQIVFAISSYLLWVFCRGVTEECRNARCCDKNRENVRRQEGPVKRFLKNTFYRTLLMIPLVYVTCVAIAVIRRGGKPFSQGFKITTLTLYSLSLLASLVTVFMSFVHQRQMNISIPVDSDENSKENNNNISKEPPPAPAPRDEEVGLSAPPEQNHQNVEPNQQRTDESTAVKFFNLAVFAVITTGASLVAIPFISFWAYVVGVLAPGDNETPQQRIEETAVAEGDPGVPEALQISISQDVATTVTSIEDVAATTTAPSNISISAPDNGQGPQKTVEETAVAEADPEVPEIPQLPFSRDESTTARLVVDGGTTTAAEAGNEAEGEAVAEEIHTTLASSDATERDGM